MVQACKEMITLLIIGDLHLRDRLGYADYITDGREAEKKEILKFITEQGKDCDGIVFVGDQFHFKNNSSETIREFVEFVESFGDKEVYMLAGNHEKQGNGKSAIDFMKEVKNPKWHIFTDKIESFTNMNDDTDNVELVFCPYFYRGELKSANVKTAGAKIMKMFPEGRILFVHHAISDISFKGIDTNMLTQEIVLPKKTLKVKYELIVAGHIHNAGKEEGILMTGSIFNNEMGDIGKKIYKLTLGKEIKIKEIELPGRHIYKLEDPSSEEIENIKKGDIVKIIFTKPMERKEIIALKELLTPICDACIIVEKARNAGHETSQVEKIMDLSIEELLVIYAKERKIPVEKLLNGFNLIGK